MTFSELSDGDIFYEDDCPAIVYEYNRGYIAMFNTEIGLFASDFQPDSPVTVIHNTRRLTQC